jgi:hypothetical protein
MGTVYTVLTVVQILFGLLVFVVVIGEGWSLLRQARRLARVGVRVEGTVRQTGRDDDGGPWSLIGYMVGGEEYVLRAGDYRAEVGDTVVLKVDPSRPLDCRIASVSRGVVTPVLMVVCGVMFVALLVVGIVKLVTDY